MFNIRKRAQRTNNSSQNMSSRRYVNYNRYQGKQYRRFKIYCVMFAATVLVMWYAQHKASIIDRTDYHSFEYQDQSIEGEDAFLHVAPQMDLDAVHNIGVLQEQHEGKEHQQKDVSSFGHPRQPLAYDGDFGSTYTLLSDYKPVVSYSVNGNLGSPGVVTDPKSVDWLKDRWQAAKDMSGNPIPGDHFLVVDLQSLSEVNQVIIDFETAFAKDYTVKIASNFDGPWTNMFEVVNNKCAGVHSLHMQKKKQHVTHYLSLGGDEKPPSGRFVQFAMSKTGRATQWGVSLWYIGIYGSILDQQSG